MLTRIWIIIKPFFLFLSSRLLLVQTIIILTIVYFVILGPTAILTKITRRDFLRKKSVVKSFWQDRLLVVDSVETAKKQY